MIKNILFRVFKIERGVIKESIKMKPLLYLQINESGNLENIYNV